MLAVKRAVGFAPKVNLRNHCIHVIKHANEVATLALKPRVDITRNQKQGYQWPHKKD